MFRLSKPVRLLDQEIGRKPGISKLRSAIAAKGSQPDNATAGLKIVGPNGDYTHIVKVIRF